MALNLLNQQATAALLYQYRLISESEMKCYTVYWITAKSECQISHIISQI